MEDPNMVRIGPAGSQRGKVWDEKGRNKIVQIFISHDSHINSIQFLYSEDGKLVLSDCHGASTGCYFDAVKLDHPSEYITCISGHTRRYSGRLTSMTIGTNLGTYGPFGQPRSTDDKDFRFRLGNQQFGGFHGTAGGSENGVESIGVYLKPNTTTSDSSQEIKIKRESPLRTISVSKIEMEGQIF